MSFVERFEKEDSVSLKHPYAFAPFSIGERNCIGQKFFMQEGLIVAAKILQKFTVHSNYDKERILFVMVPLLSPKNLKIFFVPRGKSSK